MITREEIRKEFNISNATLNNWYRTGIFENPSNGSNYTESEFSNIKNKLFQNLDKLRFRANRSYANHSSVCHQRIQDSKRKNLLGQAIQIHKQKNLAIEESLLNLSIHILKSVKLIGENFLSYPKSRLDSFLMDWWKNLHLPTNLENPYQDLAYTHLDDDFIGSFYQSITSVAQKSRLGSYFTPSKLLQEISFEPHSTVIDPCCGSGGILIHVLNKNHDPSKIYAQDIDEIALKICTINLSLFFHSNEINFHISRSNILDPQSISLAQPDCNLSFDSIITNPPWGGKIDFKEKNKLIKMYPEISTSESFSIALYNCLKFLKPTGKLIFFLPHSILNVSAHKNIRKYLISKKRFIKIDLLGNPFRGVLSEAIQLTYYNGNFSDYIEIVNQEERYKISHEEIHSSNYIIQARTNLTDRQIISSVFQKDHITLKNHADFALGIVTGNNNKHIYQNKLNDSMEPIFRGQDILPFRFSDAKRFIELQPEKYQQIPAIDKYRQVKIAYRFINNRIICALDTEQRLLLNSANLFIPKIEYPLRTIVCLLNSKLYSFIYRKMFHSKKVLKSHIEALPLPTLDECFHLEFSKIYQDCINDHSYMTTLDSFVYKIFQLSKEKIEKIEKDF